MVKLNFITIFGALGLLIFVPFFICQTIYPQPLNTSDTTTVMGDRTIHLDISIEPSELHANQPVQIHLDLQDEGSKLNIPHVTYRVTITKDDQLKLSEFFHSHTGDLIIQVRNNNSSHVSVDGTYDIMTNSILPDPSGDVLVTGPLFSEEGQYHLTIEIITIDSDKTDLPLPLVFNFILNSSMN